LFAQKKYIDAAANFSLMAHFHLSNNPTEVRWFYYTV